MKSIQTTQPRGEPKKPLDAFALAALLLTVAHFVLLLVYFQPAISTPDANGYLAQARRIATGGKAYIDTESVVQYVNIQWLSTNAARYFCKYPPGLPMIIAIPYRLLGSTAALLVNPVMGSLSLLGIFLLGRAWIGPAWGLLAAALMALNPVANQHALSEDSHTAVLFLLIWGLYFLARWSRGGSALWLGAAGLCAGLIPTVRYAELLMLGGFGLYVLLHWPGGKRAWRALALGATAAALPILILAVRNQLAFGAFWRTGYALSNEQTGFGIDYFSRYWLAGLQALLSQGSGIVFAIGLAGIAMLCAGNGTWKKGVVLASLTVPTTLLYMCYYFGGGFMSVRFLLPTFPIYTLACVWLLRRLEDGATRRAAIAASAAVLIFAALLGLPQSIQSLRRLEDSNAAQVQIARALDENVETGSIVIAPNGVDQNLDFLGSWRVAEAGPLQSLRGGRVGGGFPLPGGRLGEGPGMGPGMPGGSFPMPGGMRGRAMIGLGMLGGGFGGPGGEAPFPLDGLADAQDQPRPGQTRPWMKKYQSLQGEERFEAYSRDIWEWAGTEHRVFLLATRDQIESYRRNLSLEGEFTEVAEIKPITADLETPQRAAQKQGNFRKVGVRIPSAGVRMGMGGNDQALILVEWRMTTPSSQPEP